MGCSSSSHAAGAPEAVGETLGTPIDWNAPLRVGVPPGLPGDPRDVNWDFLVVHLKNGENLPSNDWFSKTDAYVTCKVRVKGGTAAPDGGVEKVNQCTFPTKNNESSPTWDRMQMLIYDSKAGSEFEVVIELHDAGWAVFGDDLLASTAMPVPKCGSDWESHTIEMKGGGKLNFALKCFKEPFLTPEKDYAPLGLREVTLDSSTGEKPDCKASLAFRRKKGNKKMLIEVPGRGDSFTHPHLAKALVERGYDYFHLAYRRVSRSRRWLAPDELLISHSDDFNEYIEDINNALKWIADLGAEYTHKVCMVHSTGGPILVNYIMNSEQKDTPFTHFVWNSPFLDWGQISALSELFVENASSIIGAVAGGTFPLPGKEGKHEMAPWHFKIWSTYRPHPNDRPIFVKSTTTVGWAGAVTKVQEAFRAKKGQVTQKPCFVITSESDDVLESNETITRASWLGPNVESVCLVHNGHDVLCSPTWEATQDALAKILAWLDKQTAS